MAVVDGGRRPSDAAIRRAAERAVRVVGSVDGAPRRCANRRAAQVESVSADIPVEALCDTPNIKHFAWRVEDLVMHGGLTLVTSNICAGKSAALRMLGTKLTPLRDVVVGEMTRQQSRVTDFYREIGALSVPVSTSNRWAHTRRCAKWQEHIQQTPFRPMLLVDEAQRRRRCSSPSCVY